MALFTRILNFKQAFLSRLRDKRATPRFNVGAAFPLKATLVLSGDHAPAKKGAAAGAGLSWSGRVGNMSSNGLSVMLPPAALTTRGEETTLRLSLDEHEIEISCRVAHFRVYSSYSVCGVKLNFDDFKLQKAYHQIIEAVRVGTSFEPAPGSRSSGGLVKQQWRSLSRSSLTEWRNAATRKIERFEITIGDHRLAGHVSPPGVTIAPRSSNSKAPVPAAVATEVRDFFRWVAANLPKSVPADLRDVIARLTSSTQLANGGWAAPAKLK
ncbi:MAG TPA: PilZ domain-containing protein [Lacunisphaera sp.]|nr:PilZ domain-containing protein [Lacunisphaera sp.]